MTLANGYCTIEELKDLRNIKDSQQDADLERIIEAISRFIDAECWRRFFAVTETRYYTADDANLIYIDDCTVIDALKTDDDSDRVYEVTWAATDYDLLPFNALLDSEPYTQIEITPNGKYGFTKVRKGIEILGDFGYVLDGADPPAIIKSACLLGANRLMSRGTTPLGASASAALGKINVVIRELRTDPDFMSMIMPFKRRA